MPTSRLTYAFWLFAALGVVGIVVLVGGLINVDGFRLIAGVAIIVVALLGTLQTSARLDARERGRG